MKDFDQQDIDNIRDIIDRNDRDAAAAVLGDMHPADIAELYQELEPEQAEFLNSLLDADKAADVLMELDEDDRRRLLATCRPRTSPASSSTTLRPTRLST